MNIEGSGVGDMIHSKTALAFATAVLLLTSCSGGGTTQDEHRNTPPSYLGPSTIAVPENTSTVGQLDFVARDGGELRFALDGGLDGDAFALDPVTGDLVFVYPPDFEIPADGNRDSVYDIRVEAISSAGGRRVQDIRVDVTDSTGPDELRYRDGVFEFVDIFDDVKFGEAENSLGVSQELFMTIYVPQGDVETRRPVIILGFPGGFIDGDRLDEQERAVSFARRGYVTASIDYRILPGTPPTPNELIFAAIDALQDMAAAVRFFREDGLGANAYGVDPDAIIVGGSSAGGISAVSLATAEVDEVEPGPVKDYLVATGGIAGRSSDNFATVSSGVQGAFSYSGGTLDIAYVDANSAPLFAAHDDQDPVIPCFEGEEGNQFTGIVLFGGCALEDAYRQAGAPVELFLKENSTGHVSFTATEQAEIGRRAGAFFLENALTP
jgi:acetyl esterase/lipase